MPRHTWAGCAALVLVGLAGCTWSEAIGLQSQPGPNGGNEVVLAGSLETVSQQTQTILGQLGVSATAAPAGDSVRLNCVSKSGDHFALVLKRSGQGVSLKSEWGSGDNQEVLWTLVVRQLQTPPAK